jgi:hypothetical protein
MCHHQVVVDTDAHLIEPPDVLTLSKSAVDLFHVDAPPVAAGA